MVVVALHEVAETILADDVRVQGEHGGHHRRGEAEFAVLHLKKAPIDIRALLIPDIQINP
jgi:hypothetical protein